MERLSTSTLTGVHADQPGAGGTPLVGRWLILARLLWCATCVLSLALLLASILANRLDLVTTVLLVVVTSVCFAVSGVMFWRKSNDRVILLFSLAFLLIGGIFLPPFPAALYGGIPWFWELPLDIIESLAQVAFLVFYLFPDGQFVPRWTRWLLIARAGWITLTVFLLVLNVVMTPSYDAVLQAHCQPSPHCLAIQLTAYDRPLLHQLGLSLGFLAAYQAVLNTITVIVNRALGTLIFWRKSADLMALFCAGRTAKAVS